MGYLIENCRKGLQLNSAQLMEVMSEFSDVDTTIAINSKKAVVSTNGVPYFGDTPEAAIAAAADGSGE